MIHNMATVLISYLKYAASCLPRAVRRIKQSLYFFRKTKAPPNGVGRTRTITPPILDALCEFTYWKNLRFMGTRWWTFCGTTSTCLWPLPTCGLWVRNSENHSWCDQELRGTPKDVDRIYIMDRKEITSQLRYKRWQNRFPLWNIFIDVSKA